MDQSRSFAPRREELNFQLTDRVAVVTGSSSGIGAAIASELAAAGADVVLHARRDRPQLAQLVKDIEHSGRRATVQLADLSLPETYGPLVDGAWQWQGRVDIWVNNAGADILTGPAVEWTYEQKLAALWNVDVCATVGLSRLVGQRMRDQGGVILNMGWDQALWGMAGDSGELFATAKGAIIAFSRSLAQTLAPHVRVNCLAPGWIRTKWGEDASDVWQQRATSESLVERWGTPLDVARVARFLCSDAASFIAGQTICVDGGFRHSLWGKLATDWTAGDKP